MESDKSFKQEISNLNERLMKLQQQFEQSQQSEKKSKVALLDNEKKVLKLENQNSQLKQQLVQVTKERDQKSGSIRSKFLSMDTTQQLFSISTSDLNKQSISNVCYTRSHLHQVTKFPDDHSGANSCSAIKGANQCLNGLYPRIFYKSKGIRMWRC